MERGKGEQYRYALLTVGLLRARRKRPNCYAAKQADEFPPPHGIYSLAEKPPSRKSNTICERELSTALQQKRRTDVRYGHKRTHALQEEKRGR